MINNTASPPLFTETFKDNITREKQAKKSLSKPAPFSNEPITVQITIPGLLGY